MQPASTQELLPVFDLSAFLALAEGEAPSAALLEQCKQLSECLAKTGCLVVRIGEWGRMHIYRLPMKCWVGAQ